MYWSVPLSLCLQMMPEIRVALFGANPNRKFNDWAPPAVLLTKKTSCYFLFCHIIPFCLWKRDALLSCDVLLYLFFCALRDVMDATHTHTHATDVHRTPVRTGLLCCSLSGHLGLLWLVGDGIGRLAGCPVIGSAFMTNTASVSQFFPLVSLTSAPHYTIYGTLCC